MPKERVLKIKKVDQVTAGQKRKVVIAGGGFAGVACALDLLKKHLDIQVTLLDKNNFHSYSPDFYEVAVGMAHKNPSLELKDFLELKTTVAIPFEDIFRSYKNFEFIASEVKNINFKKRLVETDGPEIGYDYLILAMGSETNFFGIAHMAEHAFELKRLGDALNIRAGLNELFESRAKHDVISIVIGGGGFTGTELAGELAINLKRLSDFYGHPLENVSLSIVEASGRLLPSLDNWISTKAKRRLEKLGVGVVLCGYITEVRKNEIILENQKSIPFHLLVWTAGVKAASCLENFDGIELEKNKCVAVNENLELSGRENVFAIGDLAHIAYAENKKPERMTAWAAIEAGHFVAKRISCLISGKNKTDFRPKSRGFVIPLGGKYALADFGWLKISGWLAWLAKRLITLKYFMSILPAGKAFRLWLRGIKIFTKND